MDTSLLDNQTATGDGMVDRSMPFFVSQICTALLGLLFNSVTLVVIQRERPFNTSMNVIVVNLTACYHLQSSTILIYTVILAIHPPSEVVVCPLFIFTYSTLVPCAGLSIFALALYRYTLCSKPHVYRKLRSRRVLLAVVIATWLIPFLIYIPNCLTFTENAEYIAPLGLCQTRSTIAFLLYLRLAVIDIGLSLVVTPILYGLLYHDFRLKFTRMDAASRLRKRREREVVRIVAVLFTLYSFQYLLFSVIQTLTTTGILKGPIWPLIRRSLLHVGLLFTSVVYGAASSRFRRSIMHIFGCKNVTNVRPNGTAMHPPIGLQPSSTVTIPT